MAKCKHCNGRGTLDPDPPSSRRYTCTDCDGSGEEFKRTVMLSNCCGAEPDDDCLEYGICPDCGEHCEFEEE